MADWIVWVREQLPSDVQWVDVREANLTGDGETEKIVIFRQPDAEPVVWIVGRDEQNGWRVLASAQGTGYAVTDVVAAPVTNRDRNNLIIGWQLGAIWSKLAVYELKNGSLIDIAPSDLAYSRLEVGDMPADWIGRDSVAELALWSHDTAEAYNVEVLRRENGAFRPAKDVYAYYFGNRVVPYYEQKVREYPDAAFYREHLREAREKAGLATEGQHEERNMRSSGLFPASRSAIGGTRWGYIDDRGDWVLEPAYTFADAFQDNGRAVVGVNGETGGVGLIDTRGRWVMEPKYGFIGGFSEGRAVFEQKGYYGVADENGNILLPATYGYIGTYRNGRAVFTSDEGNTIRYGYLNTTGEVAIPATFTDAGDFNDEGKAVVKLSDKQYALIDRNGGQLRTYAYPYVGPLSEDRMAFKQTEEGLAGYLNEAGETVIAPQYVFALPFEDGRAVVNVSGDATNLYGLIDRSGNTVIEAKYNDIQTLGEQRLAVGRALDPEKPYVGSKYALANLMGGFLTEFRFTAMNPYAEGVASATDGETTFFIDREGQRVRNLPEVKGSGTLTKMNGLIQATVDLRTSYYTPQGELIWRPNTVIPLAAPWRVKEEKFKPNVNYLVYYPQVDGMTDRRAEEQVHRKLREMSQVKEVGPGQLDYSYTGDFDVTFFRKRLLELEMNGYNYPFGAAHGMPTKVHAHIDLESGQFYTLADLFKPDSDYVKVVGDIIGRQIKEYPQYDYVFPDSYKGIAPDQPFFVSEDALYVYFNPYDIAPYAAGFPTFRIPFAEIQPILNTEGAFWRSFH